MATDNLEKKTVTFQSVNLLKELIGKGQMRNLVSIKTKEYPEYCFRGTGKVMSIVANYMAKHDLKCDRSNEDWSEYEKNILNSECKPEQIVTRNLEVVKRLVSENMGYLCKRTGIDQYHKKFFVFYANDRVIEIKNEEDEKSKERYLDAKETGSNEKQETANIQMSQLLKKVLEERK